MAALFSSRLVGNRVVHTPAHRPGRPLADNSRSPHVGTSAAPASTRPEAGAPSP